jgi:hypothetical protein
MVTLIRKRFLNKHLITRTAARFVHLTFDGCQALRALCPPVALKVSSVEWCRGMMHMEVKILPGSLLAQAISNWQQQEVCVYLFVRQG